MATNDGKMGKCCCANLTRCTAIQKKIIEAKRDVLYDDFTGKLSTTPKIITFWNKCRKWLGFPKGIRNLHIRKYHFAPEVNRYVTKVCNHITTPISRGDPNR